MNGEPQPGASEAMSEEQRRAAIEAELERITSSDLMYETAISLLNLGARRLGLMPPPGGGQGGEPQGRDLEQVRDAIDGVRALLAVLDRRLGKELAPLRDALSQLQIAYAREAQAGAAPVDPAEAPRPDTGPAQGPAPQEAGEGQRGEAEQQGQRPPGPAESSGRLWVPGR
jgi:hypothetical protein